MRSYRIRVFKDSDGVTETWWTYNVISVTEATARGDHEIILDDAPGKAYWWRWSALRAAKRSARRLDKAKVPTLKKIKRGDELDFIYTPGLDE